METTKFIKEKNKDYNLRETPCHNGEGPWKIKDIIQSVDKKLFIRFIHDDIILPGSSFGYHQHKSDEPEEEWYLCLSGNGVMTLDDKDYDMGPGDISVCYANGFHGIKNTGKEDMRIIVICASPIK